MPFSSNWTGCCVACWILLSCSRLRSSWSRQQRKHLRMYLLLVSLKAPFSCLPLSVYHTLRCSIVGCMSSSGMSFDRIHLCRTVALSSRNDKRLYPLADRYLLLQQSESCYDNSLLRPSVSKREWCAVLGSWSFPKCSIWSNWRWANPADMCRTDERRTVVPGYLLYPDR